MWVGKQNEKKNNSALQQSPATAVEKGWACLLADQEWSEIDSSEAACQQIIKENC